MKATRLADSVPKPVLIEKTIPQPNPRQGEVLVWDYAVGVTPTELVRYLTSHTKDGDQRTGAVLSPRNSSPVSAYSSMAEPERSGSLPSSWRAGALRV